MHLTTQNIFIGIATANGRSEINEIIELLSNNNYKVTDFSDNDIAKLHMRYMVGGKHGNKKEELFRFEFPERPRALLNFLDNREITRIVGKSINEA